MNAGGLRTSDADRAQVAELLQTAYAEGRISSEEHSERGAAALRSRTFDDLRQLTHDLVPLPIVAPRAVPAPADGTDRLAAVLASTKRVGPWRVAQSTAANVVFGDVLLDLTEATFESSSIEVSCSQLLGSTKIRVPLGTNVRVEVVNVLAETSVKGVGDPDPEMPTVVISGVNILGEIQVRGPKKLLPWRRHVT